MDNALLLQIANTEAGRYLLKSEIKAPIVEITHNAIIYDLGKDDRGRQQYAGEFYSGHNRNFNILSPILAKLDIAKESGIYGKAHQSFIRNAEIPWIYLNGPTDFQAATGGTGGVYAGDATYSTARSASTASGAQQAVGNDAVAGFEITRWFCPTDFTAILAGSDVTAASGSIYPTGRNSSVDDTLQFVLTTQASTSAVANGDYDNLTLDSPTIYGTSGAYSGLTLNSYNSVTMTAGFQTLVESGAGGFIKMGARASGDISNTQPGARSFLNMSQADNQRTKFTITWTPPVAGGFFIFM